MRLGGTEVGEGAGEVVGVREKSRGTPPRPRTIPARETTVQSARSPQAHAANREAVATQATGGPDQTAYTAPGDPASTQPPELAPRVRLSVSPPMSASLLFLRPGRKKPNATRPSQSKTAAAPSFHRVADRRRSGLADSGPSVAGVALPSPHGAALPLETVPNPPHLVFSNVSNLRKMR